MPMVKELNIPREGDLHTVVTIGPHSFELRYSYCDEIGICRCEDMRKLPDRRFANGGAG